MGDHVDRTKILASLQTALNAGKESDSRIRELGGRLRSMRAGKLRESKEHAEVSDNSADQELEL